MPQKGQIPIKDERAGADTASHHSIASTTQRLMVSMAVRARSAAQSPRARRRHDERATLGALLCDGIVMSRGVELLRRLDDQLRNVRSRREARHEQHGGQFHRGLGQVLPSPSLSAMCIPFCVACVSTAEWQCTTDSAALTQHRTPHAPATAINAKQALYSNGCTQPPQHTRAHQMSLVLLRGGDYCGFTQTS